MGNGPAPFSDIGKKARELLTKDYNFDHKFTLSTLSNAELGITATGVKLDEICFGDIGTQYKSGRTIVDVKVDTNSNLDVHYNGHAAISSSIGVTLAPLLVFSIALGTKELGFGTEMGFDSAFASFTKYNAGIGLNKTDFSASLMLADKGETLKASYIHMVDPIGGHAVAAEVVHRLSTSENSFTIGSSHKLDPTTMMKTKVQQQWKGCDSLPA